MSIESTYQSPHSPSLVGAEAAANVEQIPFELLKLLDFYKYQDLSDMAAMLRKLGVTEMLINGADQPSYDPREVAEKLITQRYIKGPVTPPQARWFVDEMLAVVSQSFEQENGDVLKARKLLETILNLIQGKKEIIFRNGKDELAACQSNLFDWIVLACKLGDIPFSLEQEQILEKYLNSRPTSSFPELKRMSRQFRL